MLPAKASRKIFIASWIKRSGLVETIPRARANLFFTVALYGAPAFWCKTAQFPETLRESVCFGFALKNRLRNIAKNCAKSS
jgi:hypothetical protein